MGAAVEDLLFGEVKRLCYAGLDATTLCRQAAEVLRRAVPFESHCFFTTDPLSGLVTDAVTELSKAEGLFFYEHIHFEDDTNDFVHMAQNRRPVALLSEATGGKLERSLRYRRFVRPRGFEHELRGAFTEGRALWGGMELEREHGRPDFNDREVALISRLAPHLGAGLKAATLRQEARVGDNGAADGAAGILVFDSRGQLVQRTAAAGYWLRELNDRGEGWQEGGRLPVPVLMVVGALRRALRPEKDRDLDSVPRVCVRARTGRWLTLQADLTESSSERSGETVVIIEPAGTRDVAWLHKSAYALSSREQAVVDLVVQGASTKQISQALYISEYTVQDHLSNVFDKVGVRNRQALVKRLFFDGLLSRLNEKPR
jgi:DNA-binding CsgD family transcriptional regulator